jgi:hypothetical protein
MTVRTNDPHGVFHDGAAAIVELATMDAKISAFQAARPADSNGLWDLKRAAISLAARTVNCST